MRRIPPFRTLDALRGFAAAWVVMTHCCDRFVAQDNYRYLHVPLYAFSIWGQLGVIFFFIISGYCICAAAYGALVTGKPLRRYAFERVRRIYPPYLAALVLGVLSTLVIGYANAHHLIGAVHHLETLSTSPRYWFANLLLLQGELNTGMANVVFWSLCYEVAFYAVVGVLLWIAKLVAARRGLATGTLVFVLGLAGTTYAALLSLILFSGAIFPFDLWHQFGLGAMLFFLLESKSDTVAGYSTRFRTILNSTAVVAVVLTVVYIVLRQVGEVSLGHPSSKVRSTTCLLFCLLLIGLRKIDDRVASSRWMHPLLWLGACSYSLYLVHPIVLPFVDILCRKAGLDGGRYWISFWIQFAVAIVFGRIFYYLIERHFVSSGQKKRLVEEHAA